MALDFFNREPTAFWAGLIGSIELADYGRNINLFQLPNPVKTNKPATKSAIASAAEKIDAYKDDLIRKLGYLARVRGLTDLPLETKQTLLEGLTRHNEAYEMVAIVNSQGDPVAVVSPYDRVGLGNIKYSPLFVRAFKRQEDYVNPVTINPKIHQLVTTIAVPIRNQKDEVDGILVAIVNLKFLDFVVSQTEIGKTGYTYIIDLTRNVVIAKKKK